MGRFSSGLVFLFYYCVANIIYRSTSPNTRSIVPRGDSTLETGIEEDREQRLTDNCDSIGKQVTTRHLIEATQVGETRSTDLAAVWALTAITDQEDTHLTLGGLNGRVGLTRGHGVTLGEKKEVVNESLHVLLHGGTRRRGDLVVLHADRTGGHLVQTLVDDTEGLTELLHAAKVTVVAVTVDTDGDVELNLVIGIVRLRLTDIIGNTRATEHDTSETHVERIGGVNNTDTLGSGLPDTVICEQLLGLVNAVTELSGPLVDVVQNTNGDILRDTTGANVGCVETGTGDTLVEFLKHSKC